MYNNSIDTYPGETYDIQKKIAESGSVERVGEKAKRITKDEYYLRISLAVASRSTCLKRRYGAVIVNNDEIIATGYNGNPRGMENCCQRGFCIRLCKPHNSGDYSDCFSVHAEQNALISASRRDMIGGTLYLCCEEYAVDMDRSAKAGEDIYSYVEVQDVSPCPICMRMLKNSGISKIVARGGEICL